MTKTTITNHYSTKFLLRYFTSILTLLFVFSCATFKEQSSATATDLSTEKKITHTFFIAGGLGNLDDKSNTELLKRYQAELENANANSTVIFTGDNISNIKANKKMDSLLVVQQVELTKNFKGNTIFLPGNNEWKSFDFDKMEEVEDQLKDIDRKGTEVVPNNGCPIDHRIINDDLDLILIDSKWFVANWSRILDINSKCTDIVTRRRFMEELEGYIDDAKDKNIVIAMHHPVFSNGQYAGNTTLKQNLKPLPIYGTAKNMIMDLGAFNPDHLNSRRYNYLRIAVSALAQASDRITLVSGHEENLQLLQGGGIHQIISGSLGSKSAVKLGENRITAIGGSMSYKGEYANGARGFAKLDYFEDGSSQVTFINEETLSDKITFNVLDKFSLEKEIKKYTPTAKKTVSSQVLDNPSDYDKSGFYRFLWGNRYRSYFGQPVDAPVVLLDTLYGGLKVTKEGGGHQSFSLRLEDANGKEYAMRSLKKSALKFLKFKLPGISYNTQDYRDTWVEEAISDFFTTAHPYMQLVIDPLAKAVDINHSDTQLYFVPKQDSLGVFNESYGDELYFIERRPSEEQANYKGYKRIINEEGIRGRVTDYESTTDMLEKVKSDESYSVDQRSFIRARIFDMLIGDWDRHQDQWRWIEYESPDGDKEFMPIPRDRDNAFPRFDGAAMKFINLFVPNSRNWQTFDAEIDNVKWLNLSGNKLDRALLTGYGPEVWEEEAKVIQQGISQEIIDKAFLKLPKAVQDETSEQIKTYLMQRLKTLPETALAYGKYLNKVVAISGTEKDDLFQIQRLENGATEVTIKRILKDEENEIIYQRMFTDNTTKELWVYGLGDDDVFKVSGNYGSNTRIKLIGGYGEDTYKVTNKKNLKVFDWEHEDINFTDDKPAKHLSDLYTTNSFHWRYFTPNANIIVPNLGFRTDDGLFVGGSDTYTKNGLNGNPFLQQHSLSALYYFKFQAVELNYKGIYGNIFPKWNFEMNAYYTNDRYSNNFFGFGNETINNEDNLGRDYYRSRLRIFKANAGLSYYSLKVQALFESFKTIENPQRLFNRNVLDPEVFSAQNYGGMELSGYYDNDDAGDFPSKYLYFGFNLGYKANLNLSNNSFGYGALKLGFDHKLERTGSLVYSTMSEFNSLIGDNTVFFYHTPSIGGLNGLRGFRDERFSGKSYFYQQSDIKLRLKRYVTAVSPVTIGVYGGFDYGRVWQPNEDSNIWHTSQGGGFWISSLKALTFNIGYFNSKESNLIQVGFGLSI